MMAFEGAQSSSGQSHHGPVATCLSSYAPLVWASRPLPIYPTAREPPLDGGCLNPTMLSTIPQTMTENACYPIKMLAECTRETAEARGT